MTHDEIVDLWQQRPEFLNPNVKRKNNYQTYKDRAYANGWNACMREWRAIFDMLDKANESSEEPTQEELWDKAYASADQFLKVGLDMAKLNGYTIEYNEETGEFLCVPPKGNNE